MPRYIDATTFQKKLSEIAREPDYRHDGEDWRVGVNLVGTHLDRFPTADVVEVVRCKDCVYWDGCGMVGRCESPRNGLIYEYTDEFDYCSYGERKTDES